MKNIIYNDENITADFIDLERLTEGKPRYYFTDKDDNALSDTDILCLTIKYFLLSGCLDFDFYSSLLNHNVISGTEYCITMFVENNDEFISNLQKYLS